MISRRQLLAGLAASSTVVAGCRAGVVAGPSTPRDDGNGSAGGSRGAQESAGGGGGPSAVPGLAVPAPTGPIPSATRVSYGSDPAQFGLLRVPDRSPRPGVIVVIHGGFWSSDYNLDLGTAICQDLGRRGWVTWNLEYRRLGNGGGWPATFVDVAAGIDALLALPGLPPGVDLTRVVAVGHSSGGHLAGWAATRGGLPAGTPGSRPLVRLRGVVAQAGVLDLRSAYASGLGGTAVGDLLGGPPDHVGTRYDLASPIERVPTGVPVRCVHSPDDGIVPLSQSTDFVAAARRAGDDATLVQVTGDHFALIHTDSGAWRAAVAQLPGLLA